MAPLKDLRLLIRSQNAIILIERGMAILLEWRREAHQLSRMRGSEIGALREWARERKRPAS